MENKRFRPCAQWAEKLITAYQDTLSPDDRKAFNAHVLSCEECLRYVVDNRIRNLPPAKPLLGLPSRLLQIWEEQDRNDIEGTTEKHPHSIQPMQIKSVERPSVLEVTAQLPKARSVTDHTGQEARPRYIKSTLRFGVIGWGYWGPKIARNLDSLPNAAVTMVADTDSRRLSSLSLNHPGMQITSSAEEIFRSDVDGVVIATPLGTHYQLAKAALLHGKHVLVEKPLAATVAQAEELVALAEAQRRILMVGHTFEYNPAVNELRKLVQNGDLGKIYCVETERVNLGLFRNDVNVIWDLAPHDISILLYLFDKKPEKIKVQAHAHVQSRIEDVAHLDLEFADGMNAHIHVSWLHPCKIRRITVIGDARMVVYDDTSPAEMIKIYNKGADVHADPVVSYRYGAITIPHIDWVEPLHLECEDFANAIRTGAQPRANGEVGLEVVRVLTTAQEALDAQEKGQRKHSIVWAQ